MPNCPKCGADDMKVKLDFGSLNTFKGDEKPLEREIDKYPVHRKIYMCKKCGYEGEAFVACKTISLNKDDNVFDADYNFCEHVVGAYKEAQIRNIRANVVMINDRLVSSKLDIFPFNVSMICGLKVVPTDFLPEEMLFAVFHTDNAPLTMREQIVKLETENKALREKLDSIISMITEE